MSGRIYDLSDFAICKKCGSPMRTSKQRNFNGPQCKDRKKVNCDGSLLDARYIGQTIFDLLLNEK